MVMFGVIPQLTQTMGNLMTSISDFIPQMQNWIREFSHDNQDIMKLVDQLQFQPDQAIKWGISLLGNGVGNMMNTTMSAVGSIASGLATFFISFSFACYILFQKEKLHLQVRKVIFAFIPKQKADAILNICSLTYRTFANFLAGQCLEAVILGMMFVITLSILKMPYALFNWNFDRVYRIGSYLWSLYWLCRGKFSDLYGKSKTGSFIYYSFSAFAADRR